jgi:phospholipase/carboxylesterase
MSFLDGSRGLERRQPEGAERRLLVLGSLTLALACEVSSPPTLPEASVASRPTTTAPQVHPAPPPVDPGPPPEPSWTTAGGLAYREVVLGGADPDDPLPMVVAIHGLGDHPDNFQHLLLGFPEPVRVILPRGIDPVPDGGFSWFPVRARDPDVEALAVGIRSAADHIAAGLRELATARPTLGKPVVTGFSQGGMLTFALAVHHPDVVGHAVAVGGFLPPPLLPPAPAAGQGAAAERPSIVALHGTADAAVPFLPTQAAVQALVERGMTADLLVYEGAGHMISDPMRRDLHDRLADAVLAERRRPAATPAEPSSPRPSP